jgi:hypothetical protein
MPNSNYSALKGWALNLYRADVLLLSVDIRSILASVPLFDSDNPEFLCSINPAKSQNLSELALKSLNYQLTLNQRVPGSSPGAPTNHLNNLADFGRPIVTEMAALLGQQKLIPFLGAGNRGLAAAPRCEIVEVAAVTAHALGERIVASGAHDDAALDKIADRAGGDTEKFGERRGGDAGVRHWTQYRDVFWEMRARESGKRTSVIV